MLLENKNIAERGALGRPFCHAGRHAGATTWRIRLWPGRLRPSKKQAKPPASPFHGIQNPGPGALGRRERQFETMCLVLLWHFELNRRTRICLPEIVVFHRKRNRTLVAPEHVQVELGPIRGREPDVLRHSLVRDREAGLTQVRSEENPHAPRNWSRHVRCNPYGLILRRVDPGLATPFALALVRFIDIDASARPFQRLKGDAIVVPALEVALALQGEAVKLL